MLEIRKDGFRRRVRKKRAIKEEMADGAQSKYIFFKTSILPLCPELTQDFTLITLTSLTDKKKKVRYRENKLTSSSNFSCPFGSTP